uniref:Uncharacterized protein n=1 Tax=Chromera velia CCMP2878 TaxID=1169474 RepID=A0A0G4I6T9_9ALVE|eukprot:Cvel_11494.t1-p1 / transcript=Cvel_11494.t1 / gene=Cvel_11494 / organism=Chromera_velia_CCMP2878 / gene_product=hypothetical protein / transcript_product=hypothetical protein / location=Cvel_scaffold724:48793-54479(+) / protein_length=116 / sequence_SO=supercontig / SO=protein_coding / is_pseudo=false
MFASSITGAEGRSGKDFNHREPGSTPSIRKLVQKADKDGQPVSNDLAEDKTMAEDLMMVAVEDGQVYAVLHFDFRVLLDGKPKDVFVNTLLRDQAKECTKGLALQSGVSSPSAASI